MTCTPPRLVSVLCCALYLSPVLAFIAAPSSTPASVIGRAHASTSLSKRIASPAPRAARVHAPVCRNSDVIIPAPSKEIMGVEPWVTQTCARLSWNIYEATKDEENEEDPESENEMSRTPEQKEELLFEDFFHGLGDEGRFEILSKKLELHGAFEVTAPPFAMMVVKDTQASKDDPSVTMFLSWRGSTTTFDWVADIMASPALSSRWSMLTKQIRAHISFVGLIESDLAQHEDEVLKLICKHNVKRIVFTGHSLAGGMAQVAHLIALGQLKGNVWAQKCKDLKLDGELDPNLECKTVAFESPMVFVFDAAAQATKDTMEVLEHIREHCRNFVYEGDVVPHLPGSLDYGVDAVNIAGAQAVREKAMSLGVKGWFLRVFVDTDQKLNEFIDAVMKRKFVDVLGKYCSFATILWYDEHVSLTEPEVCRPTDEELVNPELGPLKSEGHYAEHNRKQLERATMGMTAVDKLTDWHLTLPDKMRGVTL